MEVAGPEDPAGDPTTSHPPRRRRAVRLVGLAIGVIVLAVVVGAGLVLRASQPEFTLDGPDDPVRPGAEITIRGAEGSCSPLIVTLWRQGRSRLWSQTHSGDVFQGYRPDARPWWRPGGTTFTPVPCGMDGTTTITLPDDVLPGLVAACDNDGGCARFTVVR